MEPEAFCLKSLITDHYLATFYCCPSTDKLYTWYGSLFHSGVSLRTGAAPARSVLLGCVLDYRGTVVRFPAGKESSVQTSFVAQTAACVLDIGWFSPDLRRPESEADASRASSAKAKITMGYVSPSAYIFVAWCLIEHEDSGIWH
jgi:hypothetical protein